jgi:DNA-binding NarL/FixJ family response regulator
MRVAIVDDQVLLREGLARLLAEAGMRVVASEGDIDRFLGAVDTSHPDVAIIGIRLPPTFTDDGLRAADLVRTRHPGTAALVLSQYLDAGYALRLLESFPSGVGYLLKDRVSQVAVLIDAVERVVAGECVVDPSIVSRLVSRTGPAGPLSVLTPRDRDVLGLMAEGRTNSAIGQRLYLSEKTVEGNVRRIFDKLPPAWSGAMAEARKTSWSSTISTVGRTTPIVPHDRKTHPVASTNDRTDRRYWRD